MSRHIFTAWCTIIQYELGHILSNATTVLLPCCWSYHYVYVYVAVFMSKYLRFQLEGHAKLNLILLQIGSQLYLSNLEASGVRFGSGVKRRAVAMTRADKWAP